MAHRHARTSRAPSAESRTSQPISASRSRSSSARREVALGAGAPRARPAALGLGVGLLLGLGERLEAEQVEHLEHGCRRPGNVAPVCLADQVEGLGQRPRRVEVVGQRVEERLPALHRVGVGLPRLPRRALAEEVPQPLDPRPRLLELLGAEGQRLAVVAREQVGDDRLAPVAVERLGELEDVALRLRHLLAVGLDHPVVHPDPGEGPARRLGLRDLVLVVGEDEVGAAAVDRERRRPARPPPSPSTRCASRAGRVPRASPSRCPRPPCRAFQSAKSSRSSFSDSEPASSPWSISSVPRLESLP